MQFAAADVSLAALLPRVFASMLVVIFVMWIAARVMKNRQFGGSGNGLGARGVRATSAKREPTPLQVLARHGLGRNTSVTVVRAGDKTLVLGVTENNVTLLTQLDDADESQQASPMLHSVPSMTTPPLDFSPVPRADHQFSPVPRADHKFSTSQRTGSTRMSARAASSPARKGLLEQVRDLTVRKA